MTDTHSFGTFFLPGPTEVRAQVLAAMTRPMIPHRGAEFQALFERVQRGLQGVFLTSRPVFVATASATGLMEGGIRCAPPGRVLSLVNGAFSERFAHIAEACGRDVDRYEVPWGGVHDPAMVDRLLGEGGYAVVTVVHSETSTGALNEVRAISDVAHRHGATCLVDSVTGVGGAELRFDEWGLDYALTGSQKAIAIPPGLAFAVASQRFVQRAAEHAAGETRRGAYFDLVEYEAYARRGQAPNTPAISLYYALDVQLQAIAAEGFEARWARHAEMQARTIMWAEDLADLVPGLRVLAPPGGRSPTVTTIVLPGAVTSDTVVARVATEGFTIGAGYGKLKSGTIRIGHMGDHRLPGLQRCLAACSRALEGQAS
jgi:aspartate aminotransferase-like enzyme